MSQLNIDELRMLEALVKGGAFGPLRKCIQKQIDLKRGELESCDNPQQIYRIQGEIRGLRTIFTLPALLVEAGEKALKDAEKKK